MKKIVISKEKRSLIIGISLSLIIVIIGTAYAYFTWQSSNNPLVDITVEDKADVVFKGTRSMATFLAKLLFVSFWALQNKVRI